jgi:DNA primase
MGILEDLISRDFTIEGRGRWLHTREHDSLVIDSEEQMFWWNSTGKFGNAFTWLTEIKGLTPQKAKEYLKDVVNYKDVFVEILNGKQEELLIYPKLVDIFYENGKRNSRDYWYKRSISDKSIDMFRLGFSEGWYTIPIFVDGTFRNFQMRREEPTKQIKSWYKGIGPLLFNSESLKLTNHVYITEGPTDAISLLERGLPAVSHNAGSEYFSNDWFKYFINQSEIFVVYDNDSAGINGAKKVAKVLGESRCKIYTFEGFGPKYDCCDFFNWGHSAEDFKNVVKSCSKYLCEL